LRGTAETTVTRGDVTQKHPAPRFTFTTDPSWPVEPNDEGQTEMAHIVFTCSSKIWEHSVEAQENEAHSLRRVARLLQLCRRACMVIAEWDSRALQRERVAWLNDHLLADIGLTRETQIVEVSKLFYWLP
jgi:uncharacterized protein YjiS (DUF1127 family)